MNEGDNQKKPTWREMLSQRNPDLNLDDDEAVSQYMGETLGDYDKMKESRQQFNDMLGDSRAAGLVSGLATGMKEDGSPFSLNEYMAQNYLEDYAAGMSVDEIAQKAKELEAARIKKNAEDAEKKAKAKKQLAEDYDASDKALTEAAKETNVDEATLQALTLWLYGTEEEEGAADRAAALRLTKEDWTRLIYAFNRDAEQEEARKEGARSSRSRRPSHRDLSEVPTDTGAGGGERAASSEDPTAEVYGRMKRRFQ
jgi:hypothetical protein